MVLVLISDDQILSFINSCKTEGKSSEELLDEELFEDFIKVPLDYFVELIDNCQLIRCTPRDIPQYSSFDSAIVTEIDYLHSHGRCRLDLIGSILPNQLTSTYGAQVKYGENHSKLLEALGLTIVEKGSVMLTSLGEIFSNYTHEERHQIVKKLFFRIPLVRNTLIKARFNRVSLLNELENYLSASTAKRRLGNNWYLFQLLKEGIPANSALSERISNIDKTS